MNNFIQYFLAPEDYQPHPRIRDRVIPRMISPKIFKTELSLGLFHQNLIFFVTELYLGLKS
ncbi:hypothetical protein SESBI_30162 [Sesbania bispinosa]|nr:hypothetical protein SESBI_30162 [Sesbania bispinosa]